jgi:hypothetical protein
MACGADEDSRASVLYAESLDLVLQWGSSSHAAVSLEGLARVAVMRDRPERAARLCGMAEALREEIRVPLSLTDRLPTARADHDCTVAAARAALGEEAFAAAWAKGHAMHFDEAIAEVLSDDE